MYQLPHGGAVGIAIAQTAAEKAGDPLEVALQGWLIQAQLLGHGGDGVGVRNRPHQHLCGIARQNFQHRKHYGRCAQQGGHQREQALEEENTHGNKAVKGLRAQSIAANPTVQSMEVCARCQGEVQAHDNCAYVPCVEHL